jgi:hypothetical protein
MESATYLYGVVKKTARPAIARAPGGVPGATRPEVVPIGRSLWLIVAEVPLDLYGPDHLEAALRDIRWVGEVALAHEELVEYAGRLRGATVIPMKLFTMFSTRARAVAEIQARRRDLESVARRIAGSEEWGVRVTRTPPSRASAAANRPSAVTRRSGAEFLAAKKQARDAAREAVVIAGQAADAAFDALSAIARDVRRRTDAPEAVTSPPLLDAAFLVPAGRRARFRAAARRIATDCARAGAELTLTGPWPAYNFVSPGARR